MPVRLLIVEDDRKIAEIQRRFIERMDRVELCGIAHTLADALLPRATSAPANTSRQRLPKGIDGLTLDKVRDLLPQRSRWNAEDMGTEMGAARTPVPAEGLTCPVFSRHKKTGEEPRLK